MDLEVVRSWIKVLRDLALVLLATYILWHETVTIDDPDPYLIGAALVLLGFPIALRTDEWFKSNGNGNKGEDG